ncbi:MAG: cold shock and DUF1294 domain-containing protein [Pseudomonadota bacterium]
MRRDGKVIRWDADKGFGFIRCAGQGADVFFHIRDFRSGDGKAPTVDLDVSFEEIHVGGKGPRAMAVRPRAEESAARPRPVAQRSAPARRAHAAASPVNATFILLLTAAYYVLVGAAVWHGRLPWWVLPASLGLNALSFLAYWRDKRAARRRQWRTQEQTLHLLSLAGGWAGAWYAQQALRHKSSKQSFRTVYWMMVVAHWIALGAVLRYGSVR